MKNKIIILALLLPCLIGWSFGGGWKQLVEAIGVSTNTTNFGTNLSSADDTVQKALDTLDDTAGGGGGGDLKADGTVPLTANWDVGDFILTGNSFVASIAGGADTDLAATISTETDSYNVWYADSYTDTGIVGNIFRYRRGRGNLGAKTKVQASDNIARLSGMSYTGSAWEESALIGIAVGSDVSNSYPGTISFWTRNIGIGDTAVELRMMIGEDGEIDIPGVLNADGGVVGDVTGNADTSTALAVNPSACSAGDFVKDMDADGTLTCDTPAGGSGTPAGSSGDVQYNDAGSLGAKSTFNFNATTDTLTVGSIVTTDSGQTVLQAGLISNNAGCSGETCDTIAHTDTVTGAWEIDAGDDKAYLRVPLMIEERADADTDLAGFGQLWVNIASPNELWFTNDDGTDVQLGVGSAEVNNLETVVTGIADDEIPIGSASDDSVYTAIPDCNVAGSALAYEDSTNIVSCRSGLGGNGFSWQLRPQQAKLPATNPMGIDAGALQWKGLFDDTTDECARWQTVLTPYGGTGLDIDLIYTLETTSTSDIVEMEVYVMAVSDGEGDVDTDSFDTVNNLSSGSVSTTAGNTNTLTATLSNIDSAVEDDLIIIKICRDADTTDTTIDDVEFRGASVHE